MAVREFDMICDLCKVKIGTVKTTYPLRMTLKAYCTQFKHTCNACNEGLK